MDVTTSDHKGEYIGAAVAAVLIKERHIVEAFERAGATTPAAAMPLGDVPADAGGFAMRRLRRRAVVREAEPGLFYADIEVWRGLRRVRRRAAVVAVLVALAAAGATLGGAR